MDISIYFILCIFRANDSAFKICKFYLKKRQRFFSDLTNDEINFVCQLSKVQSDFSEKASS